jgi:hypothetical protein
MAVAWRNVNPAWQERFTFDCFGAREAALARQALGEHGGEYWRHVLRDEHGEREVTRKSRDDSSECIGATGAGGKRENLRLEFT